MMTLAKEEFLKKYNISNDEFIESGITWENLLSIGNDHLSNLESRKGVAEYFAKLIQGCKQVHSVRWRVKDPEHLMEKIIRKNIKKNDEEIPEKYKKINKDNYHEVVTDLVGIRAIHLFKDEYLNIDEYLRELWDPEETPIIYIRSGDDDRLRSGFDVKPHPAGYRSIHYVFQSRPSKKTIFTEIQVRTIFEEGWSEIDHKVRYPNFSDEPSIGYFLTIFNRLAGNADEMGSFVKALDMDLKERAKKLQEAHNEINELFTELEESKGKGKEDNAIINSLKKKIQILSENNTETNIYSAASVIGRGLPGLNIGGVVAQPTTALTAFSTLGAGIRGDLVDGIGLPSSIYKK